MAFIQRGRFFEGRCYFEYLRLVKFIWSLHFQSSIKLTFCFFLSTGTAGGGGQTVQIFSPSATSLLISWGHLKPHFLPDTVEGYEITIRSLSGETTKINVSILANETEVTGLEKYSRYCMTVRALTGEGYGNEIGEVCAFTAEDGKNVFPPWRLITSY